jgi:hypothetical protein
MNTILIIAFALACALAVSAAPATNAAPKVKPAPATARYQVTGEIVKIKPNLLTLKFGNNPKDFALRMTAAAKVVIETGEMEPVPGKEGETRPKTVEGKQSDLKPGQRVKVAHNGSTISQVTVLPPQAAKAKETEKKDAPPAK